MKNYWLEQKAKSPMSKRTLLDCFLFMKELKGMVDGLDDKTIQGMDFKPLYAKYPRVRIGIRRALIAARKDA